MRTQVKPTYNTTTIGTILNGPSEQVNLSVVDFVKTDRKKCWYFDIRHFVWGKEHQKFFPTQRGVTMPQLTMLELYNDLIKLPKEYRKLKEKESVQISSHVKNKYRNINLSVVGFANETKLDIREYCLGNGMDNGYKGYSTRGCRINYEMKDELCKVLLASINHMIDLENKNVDKKEEEVK